MNLTNPSIRSALVSEYTLGTMNARVRRRFERYMDADGELRREVDRFSQIMNKMSLYTKPVTPHPRVWRSIEARLHSERGPKPRLGFWRFSTLASSVAAIVLAALLFLLPQQTVEQTVLLSVVNNQNAQSAWLVSSDIRSGLIRVRAIQDQTIAADKDFELWLLPDAKAQPISLGLLSPRGEIKLQMSPNLLKIIENAAAMAVSLEPKGGSPTGAPTGPVLYQGKIISL